MTEIVSCDENGYAHNGEIISCEVDVRWLVMLVGR